MPLGLGVGEWWNAVRDRVEVAGHGPTWRITAGCFETAFGYARARFGDPVVLARRDTARWWPRVTLTVTTDPELAASAPRLEDISRPDVSAQATTADSGDADASPRDPLPSSLEEIFAHQEELRMARQHSRAEEQTARA
jgi:hypothetical protein